MMNYSSSIKPGIQLGKENGLTLLLDAEVYDYAFSPQKGEGFKLAIHSHMDQPIMALSDIDLSPGMRRIATRYCLRTKRRKDVVFDSKPNFTSIKTQVYLVNW